MPATYLLLRGKAITHSKAASELRRARNAIWLWSVYLSGASALFCMFGGGSDANNVEVFGGHFGRAGGGRVKSGNGDDSLRRGLQVLQPRLPCGAFVGAWKHGIRTGAIARVWKPGIRCGLWDAVRRAERGC